MFNLLSRTYADTHRRIANIHFDTDNFLSKTIIALYASVIEQTGSALTLLKAGQHVGVNIILRSTLEGYIDLINLIADPNYLDQMTASYHKEWIKMLEPGLNGDQPFLAPYEVDELAESLEHHRNELSILTQRGVKPLQARSRFEKAQMLSVYHTVFNALSADSHNNIRALMSRHFRIGNDGTEVVIFKSLEKEDLAPALFSFTDIYIRTGISVHSHFKSNGAEVFRHYAQQLERLCRSS
ncbi:DUF5677 domain-containing protein [Agrobacterium rosae]|uniref:DUF5677 domain-containing protein n=1 Tax=Agrobacterium rosae TaxID=1972867 RepID=UPI003BA29A32